MPKKYFFLFYCLTLFPLYGMDTTLTPAPSPSFFSCASLRTIPTTLITLCTSYPKLCIGSSLMTIMLLLLRMSPYWPLTAKDLKRINDEAKKRFHQEISAFKKNANTHTQHKIDESKRAIEASNKELTKLNTKITIIKEHINQFPHLVMNALTDSAQLSSSEHTEYFATATRVQRSLLVEIEHCIYSITHTHQQSYKEQLKKLKILESEITARIRRFLDSFSISLQEQSALFCTENNNHLEQQFSTFAKEFARICNQHNQNTRTITDLLRDMDQLEINLYNEETYLEFTNYIMQQEKELGII